MNAYANASSIPAERSVLGSLMKFPDRFPAVSALISADDFSSPENRYLFKVMTEQVRASRGIDPISLMNAGGDRIDTGYLMELASNAFARENLSEHAKIIRDHSIRRKLVSYGEQMQKMANGAGDVESLLAEASQGLSSVSSLLKAENRAESYGDMMGRVLAGLKDRAQTASGVTGISTGFSDLDELTAGLHDEDYVVIAARPSMGKTTFAMNIVENACLMGKRAQVFSMEMPREQLLQRSFASIGRIDATRLRTGKLTAEEAERLEKAVEILSGFDIIIDDTPALSLAALSARAHEAHRERPLDLIMIDYLQLMSGKGDSRNDLIGEISRGLKALAKQLKCPILILSQLNRNLEQRPNKRPVNSDLRDSGSIEQDADLILFPYRDEVYEPDTPDKGIAEIIIGKQRNGPLGTVRARFLGHFSRFEDLTDSARAARPAPQQEATQTGPENDEFLTATSVEDAFNAPLNTFGHNDDSSIPGYDAPVTAMAEGDDDDPPF